MNTESGRIKHKDLGKQFVTPENKCLNCGISDGFRLINDWENWCKSGALQCPDWNNFDPQKPEHVYNYIHRESGCVPDLPSEWPKVVSIFKNLILVKRNSPLISLPRQFIFTNDSAELLTERWFNDNFTNEKLFNWCKENVKVHMFTPCSNNLMYLAEFYVVPILNTMSSSDFLKGLKHDSDVYHSVWIDQPDRIGRVLKAFAAYYTCMEGFPLKFRSKIEFRSINPGWHAEECENYVHVGSILVKHICRAIRLVHRYNEIAHVTCQCSRIFVLPQFFGMDRQYFEFNGDAFLDNCAHRDSFAYLWAPYGTVGLFEGCKNDDMFWNENNKDYPFLSNCNRNFVFDPDNNPDLSFALKHIRAAYDLPDLTEMPIWERKTRDTTMKKLFPLSRRLYTLSQGPTRSFMECDDTDPEQIKNWSESRRMDPHLGDPCFAWNKAVLKALSSMAYRDDIPNPGVWAKNWEEWHCKFELHKVLMLPECQVLCYLYGRIPSGQDINPFKVNPLLWFSDMDRVIAERLDFLYFRSYALELPDPLNHTRRYLNLEICFPRLKNASPAYRKPNDPDLSTDRQNRCCNCY